MVCCLLPLALHGQAEAGGVYVPPPAGTVAQDTVVDLQVWDESVLVVDTVAQVQAETSEIDTTFMPDPEKVVWLGAIIPGYGQIVNKKYWQLPIVYGAYMGCAFAVTWFSTEYQFYKTAYRDAIDTDPTTNSHLEYLDNMGVTLEQMGGESAYRDRLRSFQDNYRRYRDYSILASVAVYALSILWAYVDAQLYDFDISPDLSMNIQPAVINTDLQYARQPNAYDAFGSAPSFNQGNTAVGIRWNIRLK